MAEPVDPGDKLRQLLNALADDVANLSDEEILADAHGEGRDVAREAEELRGLLLDTVRNFKVERRRKAERTYREDVERLNAAAVSLPASSEARRQMLKLALQRRPDIREITLQHRDFTELSEADVEGLLRQLHHLGVLDDPDDGKPRK